MLPKPRKFLVLSAILSYFIRSLGTTLTIDITQMWKGAFFLRHYCSYNIVIRCLTYCSEVATQALKDQHELKYEDYMWESLHKYLISCPTNDRNVHRNICHVICFSPACLRVLESSLPSLFIHYFCGVGTICVYTSCYCVCACDPLFGWIYPCINYKHLPTT